jgi:hypothetical protein
MALIENYLHLTDKLLRINDNIKLSYDRLSRTDTNIHFVIHYNARLSVAIYNGQGEK